MQEKLDRLPEEIKQTARLRAQNRVGKLLSNRIGTLEALMKGSTAVPPPLKYTPEEYFQVQQERLLLLFLRSNLADFSIQVWNEASGNSETTASASEI